VGVTQNLPAAKAGKFWVFISLIDELMDSEMNLPLGSQVQNEGF
jgi:hypothetical protein|tara:strand:- start:3151 stop:3282 length:132 start_codon:yes stop_codon:yes gene_type:complete